MIARRDPHHVLASPVVLVPGNMCTDRVWRACADRLTAAGYVVRHAPPLTAPSVAEIADAILETLDTPAVLVGFSMGAIVAVELASRSPQLVQGLALIGFNASADLPERMAVRPRQQADVRGGRLREVVGEELKPNYLADANRGDAGLLAAVMDMALSLGPDTFVAQSEALRSRPDLRTVLPRLNMPVLLACGAEDRLCPPEWHRGWAARVGDNAQVVEIDGAGHLLPLEQPQALADALLKWLAKEVQCQTAS
jgi:pimeloyl-ACP methyl ester carboxylesterase